MKNTCNNHTNNSIIFVVKKLSALMNRNGFLLYIFLVILTCASGCKKDTIVSEEGELSFSSDTVTFDTVFTTIGSATLSFKIYNRVPQRFAYVPFH